MHLRFKVISSRGDREYFASRLRSMSCTNTLLQISTGLTSILALKT